MSVSVVCLTFNHESFIEKTIKGFAMQNLSSDFEFLITDDASKDSTGIKIESFIEKYKIKNNTRFFRNGINIGVNKNFTSALRKTRYKYIAICEGDDYWDDCEKLNKQILFLELNTDFSFCCTNISVVDSADEIISNAWPNKANSFVISKRMLGNALPVPTCSLVFRSKDIVKDLQFLETMERAPWPDFFLISWLLTIGKGYFFEEKMAVYRQHLNGYYTSTPSKIRLQKSKETRWLFFLFCLKRFKFLSATICFKNIFRHPNF